MKKVILFIVCTLFTTWLNAQDKYVLTFNQNDYTFNFKNGILSISTTKKETFYSTDVSSPAFPYSPICILRPEGYTSKK